KHHPLRLGERSFRGTQPAGSSSRSRRSADRRALPLQLEQGRRRSEAVMEDLYDIFPDYARDIRLNLQNVLQQGELTEQQTWGTAVASAIAARNPQLLRAVIGEAAKHLTPEATHAAKAAAAIMGM